MSAKGKGAAKSDVAAGKVKEAAGNAVGNERMQAEGRGDQAKGHVREAAEKVKDAAEDVTHRKH